MTTLREEIKAICQGLNYEVTLQSCDEETDQIIKLFEKMIDEKIERYHNEREMVFGFERLKEELK